MMMLPDELILLVQKNVNDHDTLTNLKMSCTYFNKVITQFSLARELIRDEIIYYKDLSLCINVNCYDDTQDIFEDYYFINSRKYIHSRQRALNNRQIKINQKNYQICSPYCSECFIKHVLIGDKTNVRRDFLDPWDVIIDY